MFLTEPPSSELVEKTYAEDRRSNGYVDNLTRLWCWRPDALSAFFDARAVLADQSALSAADRALLFAATAAARGDSYCALHWGGQVAAELDPATALPDAQLAASVPTPVRAAVNYGRQPSDTLST